MIYNIRGGLGTQLMSLFAVYADARIKNIEVSGIILNFGHYTWKLKEHSTNIDFITPTVTIGNDPKIIYKDGTNKIRFTQLYYSEVILHNINFIRAFIKVRHTDRNFAYPVLHCRQLDAAHTSLTEYIRIADEILNNFNNLVIIGDDREKCLEVAKRTQATMSGYADNDYMDTVLEWSALSESGYCVGGYSIFTLAAAVLNPHLELKLIRAKDPRWEFLNFYVDNYNNIEWYE